MAATDTKVPAEKKKRMYRFKLLAGSHTQGKHSKNPSDPKPRRYRTGDVFDSDRQLDKEFGKLKFERLHESRGGGYNFPLSDEMEKMNLAELRSLAEEQEIDLDPDANKAQIMSILRGI